MKNAFNFLLIIVSIIILRRLLEGGYEYLENQYGSWGAFGIFFAVIIMAIGAFPVFLMKYMGDRPPEQKLAVSTGEEGMETYEQRSINLLKEHGFNFEGAFTHLAGFGAVKLYVHTYPNAKVVLVHYNIFNLMEGEIKPVSEHYDLCTIHNEQYLLTSNASIKLKWPSHSQKRVIQLAKNTPVSTLMQVHGFALRHYGVQASGSPGGLDAIKRSIEKFLNDDLIEKTRKGFYKFDHQARVYKLTWRGTFSELYSAIPWVASKDKDRVRTESVKVLEMFEQSQIGVRAA